MKPTVRSAIAGSVATLLVVSVAAAAYAWSGHYDVAADRAHSRPVHLLLETVRERSVQAQARRLSPPPDFASPARVLQGAGNYDAMCAACHLSPGLQGTEMSRGLYPSPPDLTRETVDAAEAFWTVKHGIKASGMPAWGASMEDGYIWNMVAFVQQLPGMDASRYRDLVARSGGHSHGGGESGHGGAAGAGGAVYDHASPSPHPEEGARPPATVHRHDDGSQHEHPAPPAAARTPPPHDHGDHDH